jgi:hypothetical protein
MSDPFPRGRGCVSRLYRDDRTVPEGVTVCIEGGHGNVALAGTEVDRGLEPTSGRNADRAQVSTSRAGVNPPMRDLGGAVPADVRGCGPPETASAGELAGRPGQA